MKWFLSYRTTKKLRELVSPTDLKIPTKVMEITRENNDSEINSKFSVNAT